MFLDYKLKTKLHYIKIHFDTPTFDTILKVNIKKDFSISGQIPAF